MGLTKGVSQSIMPTPHPKDLPVPILWHGRDLAAEFSTISHPYDHGYLSFYKTPTEKCLFPLSLVGSARQHLVRSGLMWNYFPKH